MAGSVELSTQAFASVINHSISSNAQVEAPKTAAKPAAQSVRSTGSEISAEGSTGSFQKFGDSTEEIRDAISNVSEALNAVAKATDRNLSFSVNDDTGDIVIQVTDGDTGEEIRTIPTEHVLQMKKSISSMAGLLFDSES